MGGSALLIYGAVSDDLLQPRPVPRSLVGRLLGRERVERPTWSQIGRDRRMVDLPTDALGGIAATFRDYVAGRLDPPWTSTLAVLEYLRLGIVDLHVRGDASGSHPPEWYVQLSFSGCAGMAEVSSELAAHWAERWYRAEQADLVSRFLRPYGFEPNGRMEPDRSPAVFVPLGAAGYARYDSTREAADDDESDESRYFDIDAAALETLSERERARALRKLDEDVPPLLPTDSCCCQWCAPRFDVAACDRLTPFR